MSSEIAGCASVNSARNGASTTSAEIARHRHSKAAARLDLQVLRERLGGRDILGDADARAPAGNQLSRRAEQETFTQLPRAPTCGSRPLRQSQSLGCAGEAAFFDHPGVEKEVVRSDPP